MAALGRNSTRVRQRAFDLHQCHASQVFTKPIDFGMLRSEIDTRVERTA